MRQIASYLEQSPLWLIIRTNALHSWRRLLSIRSQSRLLTGIIGFFVIGYLVLAFELFYHGMQFIAKFPGLGSVLTERLLFTLFAFLFALLLLSNLVICLHQPVSESRNGVSADPAHLHADHLQLEIHGIGDPCLVGVFVFDRSAVGGVWVGARGGVAFLSADGATDRFVHHFAGGLGGVAGDCALGGIWTGKVFN